MIRKLELNDIPRVAEIQIYAWRVSDRGVLTDEYLFKDMLVVKRMEYFEKCVKDNDEIYVYDDGVVKAFLTVGKCKDEDKTSAFMMWSIYVDPFFQRNGIGSLLIEHFENIARQRNFTGACLWVMEHNQNARTFYEKFDYAPDGKKETYNLGTSEMRYVKIL